MLASSSSHPELPSRRTPSDAPSAHEPCQPVARQRPARRDLSRWSGSPPEHADRPASCCSCGAIVLLRSRPVRSAGPAASARSPCALGSGTGLVCRLCETAIPSAWCLLQPCRGSADRRSFRLWTSSARAPGARSTSADRRPVWLRSASSSTGASPANRSTEIGPRQASVCTCARSATHAARPVGRALPVARQQLGCTAGDACAVRSAPARRHVRQGSSATSATASSTAESSASVSFLAAPSVRALRLAGAPPDFCAVGADRGRTRR